MIEFADRLAEIRQRVQRAIDRRGPGPDVTLIAVSKRHPVAAIREALRAGLEHFGENYAQEFRDKARELEHESVRWHFIGALQSNKLKYVIGKSLIHTVDRIELLEPMQRRASNAGLSQDFLIEVKLDERESTKAGLPANAVGALLDQLGSHPNLSCRGLMVIPPAGDPEQTRPYFRRLRELRDQLKATPRSRVDLHHLSMGMSGDFEVAIEEGATLIRVGTALFGPRPPIQR